MKVLKKTNRDEGGLRGKGKWVCFLKFKKIITKFNKVMQKNHNSNLTINLIKINSDIKQ